MAGCDSTVTLHLTINHSNTGDTTATACNSFEWYGVTYTETPAVAPTHEFTNVAGCDSTVTLHLTVNYSSNTAVETVTACDSAEWHGTTYYASTSTPTYTTLGVNGCDSTVTLNLTINNSIVTNPDTAVCSYLNWDGSYYSESGNYTKTYDAVNGCDSTVTMHLTVNQPVATSFSATSCITYTWNEVEYTASGAYSQTLQTVHGCDSTVTLTLTINQPTTATVTLAACESYEWHGVTYTESGTHTFDTIGSNGCDSTTTLQLTINNPDHQAESKVACESYTWNGETYTTSGVYNYSHPDVNGCTQVDTLHLTIGNGVTVYDTVETCDYYEWNGRVYTEDGDYTYETTGVLGCDSTVALHLTINHSVATTVDTMAYGSVTLNNETYTASGTYEQTLTTVKGCDSVVTYHVVILPEDFVMPYLYDLMHVMLSVNHNEAGAENVHYIYYRWYRNGELVLEGPNYDSYSEGGSVLSGCYYLEVAVDENLQYWVRSNTVCINNVGIADVEALSFNIAPNPVLRGHMVTLALEATDADLYGATVAVYDVNGREMLRQQASVTFVADLPSGMYMIRLTLSDGRTAVKRLIVK